MPRIKKEKDKRYQLKKAVGLKASTVRRLIRSGMTVGEICLQYEISRPTMYKRFGPEIKGMSPRGRRPGKKAKAAK